MFTITKEQQSHIQTLFVENPSMMLHEMAHTVGVSEARIAYHLPTETRAFSPIENFDTIWSAMATWEKVTFIMVTPNAILEVACKLPEGKYGHGFFNPMGDSPLGGHLKVSELGAICFLSKPFFGLESHSIQFFDTKGNHMFAVYVGRENRTLIPSVKEGFFTLQKHVCE